MVKLMKIYALKINGYANPIGCTLPYVVCSWKVSEPVGKTQKNVIISVSKNSDMSNVIYQKSGCDLDSAGTVLDIKLSACTRYYYNIRIFTDTGHTCKSETAWFETSKMNQPWKAKWISTNPEDKFCPEFLKSFHIEKEILSARLYICGLGLFEAYINGKKVGNDFLAPFLNDYDENTQYCTYDITEYITEDNDFTVILGDGWYMGKFGLACARHNDRHYSLISEIHIKYKDGSDEYICTDSDFEYRESFIKSTDIYDGENQDFLNYKGSDKHCKNAVIIKAPVKLSGRYSLPLHSMEDISVKEVIHTPAGETVLDMGQEFTGYMSISQTIPKGATLKLEFGEVMQNGNFYNENYRTAKSLFTYISDGNSRQIRPYFTFYGFRYVKVSGIDNIDPDKFTGKVVYSEMDRTGYIHTGNEKINRLYENSLWGMKSNFLDIPSDCPQRDERLAWTGDAMVFSSTAGFHMDTRAFYSKFTKDLRIDQKKNGGRVAIYLPNEFPGLYAGVWSDIGAFLPNMLYSYYGDTKELEKNYALMKAWVDFIYTEDLKRGEHNLYNFGFQFGDWLALDGATEQSRFGRTDSHFVSSVYYYASTLYTAKAAEVLGLPEYSCYLKRAEKIKEAIINEYFTYSGRLAIDTQTGYLLALKFGIYTDKQKIIDGYLNRFKQDCRRIKSGFVGAPIINCVLAENGLINYAYDLLFYEGFPGWLYEVNLGATTIWERWNSLLPDGTISGISMNSMNHYSFGSIAEFMYRYSAGIQNLEPGFKKAKISPAPDPRLKSMSCTFDSVYGKYVSNWKIQKNGDLFIHIEVPFNCSAEIYLPGNDTPIFVSAGSYNYTVTNRDYRNIYTDDTSLENLLKDERAVEILKNYLPEFYAGIDRNDNEAMTKSLTNELIRATLFRQPTDNIQKAIKEICSIKAEI